VLEKVATSYQNRQKNEPLQSWKLARLEISLWPLRAGAATKFGGPCAPAGTLDQRFSLSPESDPFLALITAWTFLGSQITTSGGSHCF